MNKHRRSRIGSYVLVAVLMGSLWVYSLPLGLALVAGAVCGWVYTLLRNVHVQPPPQPPVFVISEPRRRPRSWSDTQEYHTLRRAAIFVD